MIRRALLGALLLVALPLGVGRGQVPELNAYYLNVWIGSDQSPFAQAGLLGFQRLRLMTSPTYGRFAFDVAYEQALTWRSDSAAGLFAPDAGLDASSGDWLNLQGTISESQRAVWRHRVDRLSAAYLGDALEVTLGRQPISWATTIYLTPADPFQPFDPADPFRVYRFGVDALRAQLFTGPMTEVEVVVRPSSEVEGDVVTALARARSSFGSWDLEAWAGVVFDEPAVSAAATVTVAGAAVRGEAVLQWTPEGSQYESPVLRFAIGVDRSFNVFSRSLYLLAEYQRDGFGAASSEELIAVALSEPYRRGQMQVLGRDEVVALASYEVDPLWTTQLLAIWNINDPSALLTPAISFSASEETTVQAGAYFGVGASTSDITVPGVGQLPGSEYGPVPATGYVSVTIFF
jgi:GNAT superfamily N-acetyltransferase